ncbi:MAG: LamG-like jellyroll fold domain-containing protein [Nanoarchaeota archaeon]
MNENKNKTHGAKKGIVLLLSGFFLLIASAFALTSQSIDITTAGTFLNTTGHYNLTTLKEDTTNAPVSLYTFDTNRGDYSEEVSYNNITAYHRGGNAWNASGYTGGAITLNATYGHYINLSQGDYLNISKNNVTLAFWIRGFNSELGVIFSNSRNSPHPGGILISQSAGGNFVNAYVMNASGSAAAKFVIPVLNLNNTMWKHIVIEYVQVNKTTWNITAAVNGAVVGSGLVANSNIVYTAKGEANIGNWINQRSGNFTMDDFSIYNRVLSATEINALYMDTSRRFATEGTQEITNLNLAGTGLENLLNITINITNPSPQTNATLRVGTVSGNSYSYGDPLPLDNTKIVAYPITTPLNISLLLTYKGDPNGHLTPYLYNLALQSYDNAEDTSIISFISPTNPNATRITSQNTFYISFPIVISYNLTIPADKITYLLYNQTGGVINTTIVPHTTTSIIYNLQYGAYHYKVQINNTEGQVYSTETRSISLIRPMNFSINATAHDFITELINGKQQRVVIVGDSLTFRPGTWTHHVRKIMQARFGDANIGYTAIHPHSFTSCDSNYTCMPVNVSFTRSLYNITFPSINGAPDENGTFTPDGTYTKITGNGFVIMNFRGGYNVTLVYVKDPSAGVINLSVNNVQKAIIPANDGGNGRVLATYSFINPNASLNVLQSVRLSLVNGNSSQWTQFNGLIVLEKEDQGGYSYSRMSRGGVGINDYISLNETVVIESYRQLNPHLYLLMMDAEGIAYSSFITNLSRFIDRVETATPNAKIILISYHNASSANTYAPQVNGVINMSFNRNLGFINLHDLYSYAELNSLGYLDDSIHLSELGGSVYGAYVHNTLLIAEPPGSSSNKTLSYTKK